MVEIILFDVAVGFLVDNVTVLKQYKRLDLIIQTITTALLLPWCCVVGFHLDVVVIQVNYT